MSTLARPEIRHDVDLTPLNTLALPARARLFARVSSVDEALALAAEKSFGPLRRLVLGGGSNLVLAHDFDGLIVHSAIPGRALVAEDSEAWYVRAGGGENWHDFVQWTLAGGWPGLENLSLIPGTVGAAPIQNIGAYGLEVSDRCAHVDLVDLGSGALQRLDARHCDFGYRNSIFKREGWHLTGRYLITAVTFRLPKQWTPVLDYAEVNAELAAMACPWPTAQQIASAVSTVRQRKLPDPARLANAGSFFKNPVLPAGQAAALKTAYPAMPVYPQGNGEVKLAAGWLIEQAGWKGRNLGPVGMYEKQALVLVNRGGACGADVQAITAAVTADVQARFGVCLEPEPVHPDPL